MSLKIDLIEKQKLDFESKTQLLADLNSAFSEHGQGTAEVEVIITDNKEIQALNKEFRHKDKATDVLSFPVSFNAEQQVIIPNNTELHLGTIVISLEQAQAQVGRFGDSLASELGGLAAHGLRHLLGHTHDDAGQWK